MEWVKIAGTSFDVVVVDIERNFNILYSENTGRTLAVGAPVTLDPLGTFYGHKVTFKRKQGYEQVFDDLWELLSKPRYSGIMVDIVYGQDTMNYEAYVSSGSQKLNHIGKDGKVYWDAFSANFIPVKAQVTP